MDEHTLSSHIRSLNYFYFNRSIENYVCFEEAMSALPKLKANYDAMKLAQENFERHLRSLDDET